MRVLCDPRMPSGWRPVQSTVYRNPGQGCRTEHDLRVPEPAPLWLPDELVSELDLPAFLRAPQINVTAASAAKDQK